MVHLTSADGSNINGMIEAVKKEFYKHFPNGYFNAEINGFSHVKVIDFHFGLIGDKKDLAFGYRENDPMDIRMIIQPRNYSDVNGNDFDPTINYELSTVRGTVLYIKPDENSHLAFDTVKIPFRKVSGQVDQMHKPLIKLINNMAKAVKSTPYDKISFDGQEVPEKYYKTVK